jgi:hypothetical protein
MPMICSVAALPVTALQTKAMPSSAGLSRRQAGIERVRCIFLLLAYIPIQGN